ncbi:hypothetical protein J2T15_006131 [Paenibacillus harenae]|uniref:Uncharacterized protein n=1 Tax=Paenibacillus harenae TaxID=306543 RepID=A0ABT9UEL5_PAEHA|nr:hypothetical protein [Paenibacillus harenae]MDQ0116649.1 hypothetical protein [Paenibacillus harenae]
MNNENMSHLTLVLRCKKIESTPPNYKFGGGFEITDIAFDNTGILTIENISHFRL